MHVLEPVFAALELLPWQGAAVCLGYRGLTGIRGPYYTEVVNHPPAITFFLS